jgi:MFS family permease
MIDITKSISSKYLLFGSIYFIQGLLLAMGQLIIPVYLVEKSFPAPLITLIVGVIMVPWTVKFFWGALIDYLIRFGRKIFALFGGILFAAGLFAVAFIDPAKSLVLFVFFFFMSVSGLVLQDVAIDAWAIEVSHEKERGKISGVMFAGQNAGIASGFIFLAFIAHAISYNASFLISALIIIIITAYIVLFNETKRDIKSKKVGALLISEFKKKPTLYFSIFLLLVNISIGILILSVPLFMKIVFHFDIAQMGLMFAVFPIAMAAGSMVGGGMCDRYDRKKILSVFIFLSLIFSAFLIFVTSWEMLIILFAIINFLSGSNTTVLFALMMDITNPRLGGFQLSFLTSIVNGGYVAGQTISGSMVSMLGFSRVFLYSAWFLGPVLLILYFMKLKKWEKTDTVE